MGYRLCIAEKPSAAADIASTIGAVDKKKGYFEGDGYLVTWALGHLVAFVEPEEYGYIAQKDIWSNKEAAFGELPLLPKDFKTTVLEDKREQFDIIKKLMHRDDVTLIIDCGDMGSEGHYLQWLIRTKAKCNKPIKRFCATSLTSEAITNAMDNLRDIQEFEKIIEAEYCRHKADWILGISMSRALSIKYNGRVDVGRVMSPTLYFVVKRYLDVLYFTPQVYYHVEAETTKGFSVFIKKFDNAPGIAESDIDAQSRLINKAAAAAIVTKLNLGPSAKVERFDTKRRAADRPGLYDITELQRDGNNVHGYTSSKTLDYAQALYEKKLITYPRTDSRYITNDLVDFLKERITDITKINEYSGVANALAKQAGLNIDKKIVNDSKVTDHHAILITEKVGSFDISSLETGEQNILQLIIKRMLIAVAQKYIYDETKIVMSCYGYELAASGKKPVTEGFKDIQRLLKLKGSSQDNTQADAEDEQVFPQLTIGESIEISKAILTEKQTTSPKLHTEATLLTAMENAGTYIKDGSILKGIGIGTQATRAGIIKKLFDIGYCAEKKTGKTSYLEPTKLGLSCIRLLPPELYTPSVTADWEENTSRIINNSYTANQFMAELETFVTSLVQNVRDTTVEDINLSNKESIGSCVHCEIGEIQIGTTESKRTRKEVKFIYCTEKCGFVLYGDDNCFYNSTGRTLIESQFKKLIEKNSFEAKTKFKKKECFELQVSESGKACLTQKKKA